MATSNARSMMSSGTFAGQRVQEICREAQIRVAGDHLLAVAQAVVGGDDRRGLRHQPDGFAVVGLRRHVLRRRVVQADSMETAVRSTSIVLALRCRLQEIHDRAGEFALRRQVFLQLVEFGLLGQPAVPKQEDDFLETSRCPPACGCCIRDSSGRRAYPSM